MVGELTSPLRFRIPEDAGARVGLARALWSAADVAESNPLRETLAERGLAYDAPAA